MFAHIFVTRLKCLLRDKEMIFWTLFFPLVLATFFQMAFSNLGASENFSPIALAVVANSDTSSDQSFKAALGAVSSGEGRLFNTTFVTKSEAESMLQVGTVEAYIMTRPEIRLVVNQTGFSQSIIRSFVNSYLQTQSTVSTILASNPYSMPELLDSLSKRGNHVQNTPITDASPDTGLVYFYALIAMACFYGSFFGSKEVTDIQADISPLAARINMSPVHKLRAFLYSSGASLLIHFIEMLILLLFLVFVLGVDFGSRLGLILLTVFVGSVAGVAFGAFVSVLVKKSEAVKTSILISVTMLGSAMAGLMFVEIKHLISQHAPILSWINPINLLADSLFCLYYFDSLDRFARNIAALVVIIVAFCSVTYLMIRRKKYASL